MEQQIKQAILFRLNALGEPIDANKIASDLSHEYNYGVVAKRARSILKSNWYKNIDKENPKKHLL